jgi:hypothetical protein
VFLGLRAVAAGTVQPTQGEMAAGHQRTHPEFGGQLEGFYREMDIPAWLETAQAELG